MKILVIAMVVFLIPVAIPSVSNADGNFLLKACQSALEIDGTEKEESIFGAMSLYCYGMLTGVHDAIEIYNAGLTKEQRYINFCLPDDITIMQIIEMVTKYLEDNPSQLNKNEALLVVEALLGAYRCEQE